MNELRRFGGFSQMTPIVKNLVIINLLVFAACYFQPSLNDLLSMHYPTNELFKPWQLFTHMFMHGGISHILFNMFGLYSFGSILERVLGPKRFITLYFLSGFAAIGLHLLVETYIVYSQTGGFMLEPDMFLNTEGKRLLYMSGEVTDEILQFVTNKKLASIYLSTLVGASGAIYGLLAGFTYLFPNTELMLMFIPVPIKAKYLVPFVLIVYDLGYGSLGNGGDNVAHFAHIGGAVFGFLLIYYWNKTNKSSFY
jgi:rhomboid-like protein